MISESITKWLSNLEQISDHGTIGIKICNITPNITFSSYTIPKLKKSDKPQLMEIVKELCYTNNPI
jgi:hypothetical protein